MSLPAWPNSWSCAGAAGEHVVAGAAEQIGAGSAPLASLSVMVSLPPWPNTWIRPVLATVGVPPGDRHGAAVDEDLPGRVAADRDRVVEGVAEHGQHARRQKRKR